LISFNTLRDPHRPRREVVIIVVVLILVPIFVLVFILLGIFPPSADQPLGFLAEL